MGLDGKGKENIREQTTLVPPLLADTPERKCQRAVGELIVSFFGVGLDGEGMENLGKANKSSSPNCSLTPLKGGVREQWVN